MSLFITLGVRRELLALSVAGALSASCDRDGSSTPTSPGPPAPQVATRTLIRAANFASDLPQVDLLIDGAVRFSALGYSRITSYQEIPPGTHRIEFRSSSSKLSLEDPLQATLNAATGDALTVSAAGLVETHSLRVLALSDDLHTDPGRVRLKFVNAVPDFPAGFDLTTERTGILFVNVGFQQATGYRDLEQGNYDFEVRRTETVEVVALVPQGLARNANYTLFAFGSLRRGDFSGRVVLDAGSGGPTERW